MSMPVEPDLPEEEYVDPDVDRELFGTDPFSQEPEAAPTAAAEDFTPLNYPDLQPDVAPAAAAEEESAPITSWDQIKSHPEWEALPETDKLEALSAWDEYMRQQLKPVDETGEASAELERFIIDREKEISPTYATRREMRNTLKGAMVADELPGIVGDVSEQEINAIAEDSLFPGRNTGAAASASLGKLDVWSEVKEKRKSEQDYADFRDTVIAKTGDEALADLVIERETKKSAQQKILDDISAVSRKNFNLLFDAKEGSMEQAALGDSITSIRGRRIEIERDALPEQQRLDEAISKRVEELSKVDNGIGSKASAAATLFATWAKNSTGFLNDNFMGRGLMTGAEGLMKLSGMPEGELKGAAHNIEDSMEQILEGRVPEHMVRAFVNPSRKNETISQVARGAGTLIDPKTPLLGYTGYPGLLAYAALSAEQGYHEASSSVKESGGTSGEAHESGLVAAALQLPALIAYGAAGKAAGKVAEKILPISSTPLAKAAVSLPINAAANMAASGAIRVAEGQQLIPENFVETTVPDILFALHGATGAYKSATAIDRLKPTMAAVADGTHPEVVLRKAIIDSPMFDAEAKDIAQKELAAWQQSAGQFFENLGQKAPEDKGLGGTPEQDAAYQRMVELATERGELMKTLNSPDAPPAPGTFARLEEINSEMKEEIKIAGQSKDRREALDGAYPVMQSKERRTIESSIDDANLSERDRKTFQKMKDDHQDIRIEMAGMKATDKGFSGLQSELHELETNMKAMADRLTKEAEPPSSNPVIEEPIAPKEESEKQLSIPDPEVKNIEVEVEPPVKPSTDYSSLFTKTYDEIDKMEQDSRSYESTLEIDILGEAGAKKYRNLLRQENSWDNKEADLASQKRKEMENALTEDQREKLLFSENPGFDMHELQEFKQAINFVGNSETANELGHNLRFAASKFNPDKPDHELTKDEAQAKMEILEAAKLMQQKGWDPNEVANKMIQSSAERFYDFEDAAFMLEKVLKYFKQDEPAPERLTLTAPDFEQVALKIQAEMDAARQDLEWAHSTGDEAEIAAATEARDFAAAKWIAAFDGAERSEVASHVAKQLSAGTHEWIAGEGMRPISKGSEPAPEAAPAEKPKPKVNRGFRIPYAPLGVADIIDFVVDQGGIKMPKKGDRSQEYDDAPEFKGVYRRLATTKGAVQPDEMAQMLADNGLIKEGTVGEMWAALASTAQTRQNVREQEKTQARNAKEAEQQDVRFNKDAKTEGKAPEVHAENLATGDVVEVGGEPMKVKSIDPDTFDVTLEDGKKYGIQVVSGDEVIYGEHLPVERTTFEDDPFSLDDNSPAAVEAERGAQAARDAIKDGVSAKLTGDAGDLTADMFEEGETPLFNKRRDVPAAPAEAPVPATEPSASIEQGLTAEQNENISGIVSYSANKFKWRNEAEKDSATAEVQTAVEAAARKYIEKNGSLDGFAPSVVASSRFRDILRRSEQSKTQNVEPTEKGDIPSFTEATDFAATDEAPSPVDEAHRADVMSKVNEALADLSDKGEKAEDKRKIVGLISAGSNPTEIAKELGWKKKNGSPDVTRVQRTLLKVGEEIMEKTKLTRNEVLGFMPPGFAQMIQAVTDGVTYASQVWKHISDIKPFNDFRRSLLQWSMTQQRSSNEIMNMMRFLETNVKNSVRREGITNWIQANGDSTILQRRRDASNLRLRKGYQAAMDLNPAEVAIARSIKSTYDTLLRRGIAFGVLTHGLNDYVNQIWKRPNALNGLLSTGSRKLNTYFRFKQSRIYDNFFEGEQAGLTPATKDISRLLGIYMNEMNNAIASKYFVLDLKQGRAADGRPLVSPTGHAMQVNPTTGDGPLLIWPKSLPEGIKDYKPLPNQPALHGWKWAATDAAGNPTMYEADLALHPEIFSHMQKIFSKSLLREWWGSENSNPLSSIPKAVTKFLLDDVQAISKQTMLGFFSPFHAVQEATHAGFHRVNPFFNLPHIDLTASPQQRDAAAHGLMLQPDRVSQSVFMEGLSGGDRNIAVNIAKRIPKLGPIVGNWADGFQHWLFHSYIPALKYKTYEHIVDRNMDRYSAELNRGEITEDQVKYLSAAQSNAAYGHLNYADLARGNNLQHFWQTVGLAPDFLEARGRFTAQAIQGLLGRKAGREQFTAMLWGSGVLWFGARIMNKLLDDDWHADEGFDIIKGDRRYTIRSVPEDIYHLISDPRKFLMGRMSPVSRLGWEIANGKNYRGEEISVPESLKEFSASIVPLTIQPMVRGMSETTKNNPVTPGEQLIGALGMHIARYSPVTQIYPIAKEWQQENAGKIKGVQPPSKATYPVSKYQQLRYALEDGDYDRAAEQFKKIQGEGEIKEPPYKIRQGFQESLKKPLTGTKYTDEQFRDSLEGDDRKIYDAARARKKLLFERYIELRRRMTKENPAPK